MKIYQNIEENIRGINKEDLISWNDPALSVMINSEKKQKLNNDISNFMGKYRVFI